MGESTRGVMSSANPTPEFLVDASESIKALFADHGFTILAACIIVPTVLSYILPHLQSIGGLFTSSEPPLLQPRRCLTIGSRPRRSKACREDGPAADGTRSEVHRGCREGEAGAQVEADREGESAAGGAGAGKGDVREL